MDSNAAGQPIRHFSLESSSSPAITMAEYTAVDIQQIIAGDKSTSYTPQMLATPKSDKPAGTPSSSSAVGGLMNISNITLDDSTPSDSGVQLLDSVSSLNASMVSSSGFEFDMTPTASATSNNVLQPPMFAAAAAAAAAGDDSAFSSPTATDAEAVGSSAIVAAAAADDAHNDNNVTPAHVASEPTVDEMKTSVCSTFDAEPIVYRRKSKKTRQHSSGSAASSSGPKKRVSFHEDILNNTKTDNIHIEHGFITYKGGPQTLRNRQAQTGRYSWCPDGPNGQGSGAGGGSTAGGFAHVDDDDGAYGEANGQYYYRNACSDVLDYGRTDVYEKETLALQDDRSGVFEYGAPPMMVLNGNAAGTEGGTAAAAAAGAPFYKCNCSSSNSSLSDESSSGTDRQNGNDSSSNGAQQKQLHYGQAKSSSCDCIGNNKVVGALKSGSNTAQSVSTTINDNCYYSEPNIERLSVWSKEKKPKSSCLKTASRRHTGAVMPEYDLSHKVKTFNVHTNKLVPDMSKNIFGSLKQIFTMPLPERGVPEGCEDLHSVFECVPEADHCSPVHKPTGGVVSSVNSARPFLSKSFDGGLAKGTKDAKPKKYVHNVDEQLRHHNTTSTSSSPNAASRKCAESPRESSAAPTGPVIKQPSSNSPLNGGSNRNSPMADRPKPPQEPVPAAAPSPNQMQASPSAASATSTPASNASPSSFRNKYIVNCESTVFEHTGVSYEADTALLSMPTPTPSLVAPHQPNQMAAPVPAAAATFSVPVPFRKKLSNMIRSFREPDAGRPKSGQMPVSILPSPSDVYKVQEDEIEQPEELVVPLSDEEMTVSMDGFTVAAPPPPPMQAQTTRAPKSGGAAADAELPTPPYDFVQYNVPMSMDTSMRSDLSLCSSRTTSSTTSTTNTHDKPDAYVSHSRPAQPAPVALVVASSPARSRHLVSPMRKQSLTTRFERPQRMSPDLFGGGGLGVGGGCGRSDSKCTLSDDFDDILTITTTTGGPESGATAAALASNHDAANHDSELVIVDYPDQNEFRQHVQQTQVAARPSSSATNASTVSTSSKSSLINRFLRNVTQKKIADATIQKNVSLAQKLRSERKLCDSLYVRGARARNPDLIEDLNAEIALEIEMSGCAKTSVASTMLQQQQQQQQIHSKAPISVAEFGLGVGEIAADLFAAQRLHILRDDRETLMKVFKLYTGYSLEGHMTPVLVFLTDKTLYVTDLIRSRLYNKFVLPYTELDVILIGPHGNTVLLSNSARDMQQVLLAGGPYPADGLVSSLEMCARRGGSVLPAVGQLTLDHLAPLQQFVRENSSVAKNDPWIYYAVVSVPANLLNHDVEPLGPHIKGPLMFRNVPFNNAVEQWQAGYFLLKAGVLYMFNDAQHRIPSLVIGMYECKGARRANTSSRPHCFELMLKTGFMQLAAPDEYVASDWLQALVQAASGLFEMQERHKALGCTLVLTSNHLITLREDFTAPLRRVNATAAAAAAAISPRKIALDRSMRKLSTATGPETPFNDTASNISSSTITRYSDSRRSSAISSPSRSIDGTRSPRHLSVTQQQQQQQQQDAAASAEKSSTSMSSIYGKNSGVEIKTCASLQEIALVRIPAHGDNWWCILEFSCQEVRENLGDMVVFFATNSDMRRFLTMLETLWRSKNDSAFPLNILGEEDAIGKHCSDLFMDINKSWDALISAALGHAQ